jgi:hypothetical protein
MYYSLIGSVFIQTLHVDVTTSAPVSGMEIQLYYSSVNEYQHVTIYASGTYDVPLLHDVADPDYLIITIKPA